MVTDLHEYFSNLSDDNLIQMANELNKSPLPMDGLVRKAIQDCYTVYDKSSVLLISIGLGMILCTELANRLDARNNELLTKPSYT